MGAALIAAAGLVWFGDKTPAGSDVAEASERRAPAAGAVTVSAAGSTTSIARARPAAAPASGAAASPGAAGLPNAAGTATVAAAQPAPAPAANASANSAANSAANAGKGAASAEVQILRLAPRDELLGESEGRFGGGEGLFGSKSWTPPPPPPPPPAPPPPPPPPQAPPLPFTYIGKAAADGAWEVFLVRADKTYLVRNKTVIDGVYRVDTIAPPMLTLTYLPLNQTQQLNIGVPD